MHSAADLPIAVVTMMLRGSNNTTTSELSDEDGPTTPPPMPHCVRGAQMHPRTGTDVDDTRSLGYKYLINFGVVCLAFLCMLVEAGEEKLVNLVA